ncbi:hypothetical protein Bbelb_315980 [Branchiostoma belcheri]|nr:hypothetical protein Bbelb_315980 [Branchiostoma belcheri]
MSVDLDRQLHFPSSICATTLRPDLVLWSEDQKSVVIVELTVPWEENIQVAFERKKTKYEELVQQCRLNGWKTQLYPVEIGVRGFAGSSLLRLCRDLQIRGKAQAQLVRRVSEEVEKKQLAARNRLADNQEQAGDGRERPHRGRRAGNPTRLTFQQGWSPYHLQQVVLQRVSPGVLRERGCEMDPLEQIHRCRQGPIKDQEKERY